MHYCCVYFHWTLKRLKALEVRVLPNTWGRVWHTGIFLKHYPFFTMTCLLTWRVRGLTQLLMSSWNGVPNDIILWHIRDITGLVVTSWDFPIKDAAMGQSRGLNLLHLGPGFTSVLSSTAGYSCTLGLMRWCILISGAYFLQRVLDGVVVIVSIRYKSAPLNTPLHPVSITSTTLHTICTGLSSFQLVSVSTILFVQVYIIGSVSPPGWHIILPHGAHHIYNLSDGCHGLNSTSCLWWALRGFYSIFCLVAILDFSCCP